MMSDLHRADEVVREMQELGAVFTVIDAGKWSWEPKPEIMRGAIRRHWQSIEQRPADVTMVGAILRSARERQ